MDSVARRFTEDMDRIVAVVALTKAVQDLSRHDISRFRTRHVVGASVTDVHTKAKNPFLSVPIYDGAFLTGCAQFELAVRQLIERFIESVSQKLSSFNHLPSDIRSWHTIGCANVILRLDQDRFRHLTMQEVLECLASCISPSKKKPYRLLGEAFSDNERNFRADEIEKYLARLGVVKVWQKLSRDAGLKVLAGGGSDEATEQRSREKLNLLIERRNAIIHRGRSYYTPGESEVVDCAVFLKALIAALSGVLTRHLESL